MLQKLEKKIGKFAIPHLINYLLVAYLVGYVLLFMSEMTGVNVLGALTLEPYYIIHKLQIWRLFTWIIVPPTTSTSLWNLFFVAVMVYFYYSLGNTLEATWGTFKFNLYIFGGLFFTIIGAFISYAIVGDAISIGSFISTSNINLTIFLAFAVCFPEMRVMLYFLIPVKMRWMAILYAVIQGWMVLQYTIMAIGVSPMYWAEVLSIVASILNFVIFFFSTRGLKNSPKQRARKRAFQDAFNGHGFPGANATNNQQTQAKNMNRSKNQPIARHKCAICGKTDLTNPELEFRFCSKCNGNYEYCQNHLFTHTHKK